MILPVAQAISFKCANLQDLISELQAGSPCKENQPALQQHAAPAPAVAAAAARAGPSKPALAPSRQNVKHSSAANRQAAMRQQLEVWPYTLSQKGFGG